MLITKVQPNTTAADKALLAGDVIVKVQQEPVAAPEDVERRLAEASGQKRAHALVLIRRNPGISMLPAVGLSAFLCAAIVLPFAQPLSVSGQELLLLALFGMSQFGLGLLLLALGTPLVSAAALPV